MADEAYRIPSSAVATALSQGRWCVFRWEQIVRKNVSLDYWKTCAAELCTEAGVNATFIDIRQKRLTVVLNVAAMPTQEQIQNSISAVEADRLRDST